MFLNPIRSYPFAQTVSVLGYGQLLIVESNIRLLYHFEKRLFQQDVEISFDSVRQVNLRALKGGAYGALAGQV